MRIRAARPEEGEQLAELQREASVKAFSDVFPPDRYPYPDAENQERWRRTLATHDSDVLVAEEGDEIVGVVVTEGAVLRSLFVSPVRWGDGAGRALHDAAIARMSAVGHARATLQVLSANKRARHLYELSGWAPTGRTTVSPFPPKPELMEYELDLTNRRPESDELRPRHPFVGSSVAARYAKARPGLHGAALALVADRFGTADRALDVACGTGLSTRALTAITRTVVGIDASEDMIRQVDRSIGAALVLAAAEDLPFPDACFDLATVASAIHWFEPGALPEIQRVLEPDGGLFVYDVWFPAEMAGEPTFGEWLSDTSAGRYPPVPKNPLPDVEAVGLRKEWEEDLRQSVAMSPDELVEYLMTHSERIAAVKRGQETEDEQRRFLLEGVGPFFRNEEQRFLTFGIESAMYRVT